MRGPGSVAVHLYGVDVHLFVPLHTQQVLYSIPVVALDPEYCKMPSVRSEAVVAPVQLPGIHRLAVDQ